jgi:hypothetical protein
MAPGWVYVLVNPAMPGLVKVGRTTRPPSERVAELSGATGVATPFISIFEQDFADCVAAERAIHLTLDRCHLRYARNREFFLGPTTEIIRLVQHYAARTGDDAVLGPLQSGIDLTAQGDKFLFGDFDTVPDLKEAMRCYQLAASRGSLMAFERLGAILAQVKDHVRGCKMRAMIYLREGAKRGNYYCYCEMAMLAAGEGDVGKFIKAWELFFVHRYAALLDEVEGGAGRYVNTLQRYVVTCFRLNIEPAHEAAMIRDGEALVKLLTETRAMAGHTPATRRHVARGRRWAKQTLLEAACGPARPRRHAAWLPQWVAKWRDATA